MESSSAPQYTVFISHAGTDKQTIAMPLRAKLMSHNVTAFVDEADMDSGIEAEPAMIAAMESVDIAFVVLSPEFVARKWPMKELMCFLRRREETRESLRCLPVIIPFFYRLNVSDLYDEPRLDRVDGEGQSLYRFSRFLERMDKGEPEAQVGEIKAALQKVHGIMGVRNDNGASNGSTDEMKLKREKLLDTLCGKILNAIQKSTEATEAGVETDEEKSEMSPTHFDRASVAAKLVFNFWNLKENRFANTKEGQLLEKVLSTSKHMNRVIAIRGIGGVGKTSLLRALCGLAMVKRRFRDGVYQISMGAHCTRRKVIEALSDAVEDSGGVEAARKMRGEKEFVKAIAAFRSWFEGKRCMFAIDDVWSSGQMTSVMISEIVRLHESGMDSKVLLTTRSAEVALSADTCIAMEPYVPLGSESRNILMRYSGIEVAEDVTVKTRLSLMRS